MTFNALNHPVHNRGTPPEAFLLRLVQWGRTADCEIFAPNSAPGDIYNDLKPLLGTLVHGALVSFQWDSPLHRRAALLELLRVLAGFESSWKWTEGVDVTNQHSQAHIEGQETGIFQVSYDSLAFSPTLRECVVRHCGTDNVRVFIDEMKSNHDFALEYCARLLRFSYRWDGPIKRHEVDSSLYRPAVAELQTLLT